MSCRVGGILAPFVPSMVRVSRFAAFNQQALHLSSCTSESKAAFSPSEGADSNLFKLLFLFQCGENVGALRVISCSRGDAELTEWFLSSLVSIHINQYFCECANVHFQLQDV